MNAVRFIGHLDDVREEVKETNATLHLLLDAAEIDDTDYDRAFSLIERSLRQVAEELGDLIEKVRNAAEN